MKCKYCKGEASKVETHANMKYWVCHVCEKTLGRVTEVYSRIVGYLRPVDQWNKGKQAEFKARKTFNTNKHLTKDKESV